LKNQFDVEIHRAHSFDEASKMAADTTYDLVMINRVLDADASPGMAILHALKSQPTTADIPVMIVSNFQDAQDKAIESGAVLGFGKAELDAESTRQKLAKYLT